MHKIVEQHLFNSGKSVMVPTFQTLARLLSIFLLFNNLAFSQDLEFRDRGNRSEGVKAFVSTTFLLSYGILCCVKNYPVVFYSALRIIKNCERESMVFVICYIEKHPRNSEYNIYSIQENR